MLRPLDARVVVKKQEREEQTASGIFLPDTASEQGQTAIGEVLAVGPGSRNMMNGESMPMEVEVGETILYTKFGGTEVQHNGEEFILLAEKDIIAVIEEK
jgi:chaperonin GroES|tara:strand:- start:345 stop:644 length:300 start_codon:yes stop_codon:yes gene_type:complete